MSALRSALVTGATGFIGTALVKQLVRDGVNVSCVVRPHQAGGRPRSLKGIRFIEADLGRGDMPEALFQGDAVDVVFNLASYGVDQTQRDPRLLVEGNAGVIASLATLASRSLPRPLVIHVGSCSEYGDATAGELLNEAHPLRPTSPYGAAKAAASMLGTNLAKAMQIPFAILRLFGVYGDGESSERLIPYLISQLQQGRDAELTGGEQVRDLLYVDDAVEALLMAARNGGAVSGGVYNVCSSRPTRIREVGEAVARVSGCPQSRLRWGARPYRADEPMWLVGDNRQFREATSWQPRISVEDGIRRMVDAAAKMVRD